MDVLLLVHVPPDVELVRVVEVGADPPQSVPLPPDIAAGWVFTVYTIEDVAQPLFKL
jgi:hypothetical protein